MSAESFSDSTKVTLGPDPDSPEVYGFYLPDGAMVCPEHGLMDQAIEGSVIVPILDRARYSGCVICALPDE